MGCGQQPGIPCALALKEGDNEMQTSGVSCRGNDGACLDIVIASEVKQSRVVGGILDCVASLAMTMGKQRRDANASGERRCRRSALRRRRATLVDAVIAPAEIGHNLVADGAEMMREFVDGDAFAEQGGEVAPRRALAPDRGAEQV